MDIEDAIKQIKGLYQSANTNAKDWADAAAEFRAALDRTDDFERLEACVIADENWDISVEERQMLLKKAKALGANSKSFLADYYGFLAAHLDPGQDKDAARAALQEVLAEGNSGG